MPDYLKTLAPQTAALLVETRAFAPEELQDQVHAVADSLKRIPFERPFAFTDRVAEYTALCNIRKGLFPAVGAMREIGTTVIIEDVAFPIDRLAKATLHLQDLMRRYRYDEAIIFGHALEGNLHFVFTQDFGRPEEVERYRGFMDEVCDMVVNAYDGSLKAEHGTGRNMAPFVELEWGREAYAVMQRISNDTIAKPFGAIDTPAQGATSIGHAEQLRVGAHTRQQHGGGRDRHSDAGVRQHD